MLAGVAGGLAEYFETDPVLIRLIFVFFTLFGGAGLLLYIILMIIMADPKTIHEATNNIKQEFQSDVHSHPHYDYHRNHNRSVLGFFLILIGVFLLMDKLFPGFGIKTFWPLLLIFIGLTIMLNKHQNPPHNH